MDRGLVGYSPWGLQRIWPLVTNTFLHMYTVCVMYFALLIPQFSSVTQSCLTLCDSMGCSNQPSLSITNSLSLFQLTSTELVMPSNHLILCRPLFPPSKYVKEGQIVPSTSNI